MRHVQLGHYHEFVAGDGVFLDGLCNDFFRNTVGVDVGCIPSVETFVVGILEQGECLRAVRTRSTAGAHQSQELAYLFLLNDPWCPCDKSVSNA